MKFMMLFIFIIKLFARIGLPFNDVNTVSNRLQVIMIPATLSLRCANNDLDLFFTMIYTDSAV